jgi:ribosomal protein S18 acetylase RimI-like enzyme
MLMEAAYRPGSGRPPIEAMLATPEIARYIADWGRPGDAALIAVDDDGECLGAAWYRLLSSGDPGFGFLDEATPELSIGVVPDRRGQGIGSALLTRLIEQARNEGFRSLSLSVSPENPAVALYRRHGFTRVPSSDKNWTMRLDLLDAGAR